MFQNCVPEEFVDSNNQNYIFRDKGTKEVKPLRVMAKIEWEKYKQTVQLIKNEVSSLSFG